MSFNAEPKYPNRRAYVLKLRSDAKPDAIAGRLENLATGRQSEFTSAAGLVESIAEDMVACGGTVTTERKDHAYPKN
jgi:hypothetical protein